MSPVKSFRELTVWQRSMDLATWVYRTTSAFPRDEVFGLTSQMRRAAVSVPSNIAEGQCRNSTKDFKHFLAISQGSLAELQTQLELSIRLGYLPEKDNHILQECQQIAMMINGLIRALPPTKP